MKQEMDFILIGIEGDQAPDLSQDAELQQLLREHRIFSGGERQRKLVAPMLPEDHEWIPLQAPLKEAIAKYADKECVVVFVSGDPYFFGFGKTIQKHFPDASIRSFPASNAIQLLAQRLQMEYGDLQTVTLHGRERDRLYEALLRGIKIIGVLTDEKNSPDKLAEKLLNYGYGHYRMHVGEQLGGPEEKVRSFSLEEASKNSFASLNCFILESEQAVPAEAIHPDESFHKLPGRPGMITNRAVRAFTLAAMEPEPNGSFWDIGTCTGSIAIDAQTSYPGMRVTAFEKKEESWDALDRNLKAFGTPGIRVLKQDFLEGSSGSLEDAAVDRIFVGGHGGQLEAILEKGDGYLRSGGRIGLNAIRAESCERFEAWVKERTDYQLITDRTLRIDQENPIRVLIAQKGEP